MAAGLEIKNLSLWRGNRQLLRSISLQCPPRTLTALLGGSGSGKSTLLKCINQLHEPGEPLRIEGSICLDGEELLHPKTDLVRLRRQVGMVFQSPAPFDMSIEKNVAYGIRLHERPDRATLHRRVCEALRQAALFDEVAHRLDADALQLSGGQQQRLCIARALAVRPRILLLDEPTSALDPLSTQRIETLLLALKGEMTLLLVTHDPRQALRCADYAAVLAAGEVCEQGTAKRVLTAPRAPQTRALLGF